MNQALREQTNKTLLIAKELLGGVDFNAPGSEMTISAMQEKMLETYAAMLEQQEQELVQQLNDMVMEMSAKIAATRNLRYTALREMGKQEGLRLGQQDNERGVDSEKAGVDTIRGNREKAPHRPGENTSAAR